MDQDTNLRLLRYLEANPEANQRELAEHLGVSLGKANITVKFLKRKVREYKELKDEIEQLRQEVKDNGIRDLP